jgi:hypothetical protein
MAIETSATQQSRRPRHNPENNNPNSTKEPIAPEMIQERSTTMTYTDINNTSENFHAVDKPSLINFFQSCSNCTFHINIKN